MTSEAMQAQFLGIQNELMGQICCKDAVEPSALRTVAGVDLAYWNDAEGREHAVCCIVVLDIATRQVLEKKSASGEITVPYLPGFLAFRELPLVMQTAALLENPPDVYMFDGNGYLHPRHMGIATHAAFFLNKPTLGVAKTYFRVRDDADYIPPADAPGSFSDIIVDGEVYGRALRTHRGVKPIFLSIGHNISLDTATTLTLSLIQKQSHIPLPTRLADLETHIARKALTGK